MTTPDVHNAPRSPFRPSPCRTGTECPRFSTMHAANNHQFVRAFLRSSAAKGLRVSCADDAAKYACNAVQLGHWH